MGRNPVKEDPFHNIIFHTPTWDVVELKCACGHTQQVDLSFLPKDRRPGRAVWYTRKMCTPCYLATDTAPTRTATPASDLYPTANSQAQFDRYLAAGHKTIIIASTHITAHRSPTKIVIAATATATITNTTAINYGKTTGSGPHCQIIAAPSSHTIINNGAKVWAADLARITAYHGRIVASGGSINLPNPTGSDVEIFALGGTIITTPTNIRIAPHHQLTHYYQGQYAILSTDHLDPTDQANLTTANNLPL